MTSLTWANRPLWFAIELTYGLLLVNAVAICALIVGRRRGWDLSRIYAAIATIAAGFTVVAVGYAVVVLVFLPRQLWGLTTTVLPIWAVPVAGFMGLAVVRRQSEVPLPTAVTLGSIGWTAMVSIHIVGRLGATTVLAGDTVDSWLYLGLWVIGIPPAVLVVRRFPVQRPLDLPSRWIRATVAVAALVVLSTLVLFPQAPVGTAYPDHPGAVTNETAPAYAAEYEEVQALAFSGPGTAECRGSAISTNRLEELTGWNNVSGQNLTFVELDCTVRLRSPPLVGLFDDDPVYERSYWKLYAVSPKRIDDFCNERAGKLTCPPNPRYG